MPVGSSILEAAQKIDAPEGYACGGVCACSTCHVYVAQAARSSSPKWKTKRTTSSTKRSTCARARASDANRRSSRDGEIEVEITRESLDAFENEHPEMRGKYTKR